MDTELLMQTGLSEIQAKIYLYLIKHEQSTPAEIATGVDENRTTVYSAAEKQKTARKGGSLFNNLVVQLSLQCKA